MTPTTQGRNEGMRFDRIFLTDSLGEVTWCHEQIEEHDVEYVNKSIMDTRDAEHKKIVDGLREIIVKKDEALDDLLKMIQYAVEARMTHCISLTCITVNKAHEALSLTEPAPTKGSEG